MDNEEEKEQQEMNHMDEDMLELRLSSYRPSRPQPSVLSQPQPMSPMEREREIHQLLSKTYPQTLVPTPQPHATNQVSNTHPLHWGEPLLQWQDPIFHPINSPNGQSSTSPSSLPSQSSMGSQQDNLRPMAMQMTPPHAVVHEDARPIPMQIPPPPPVPVLNLPPCPVNRRVRRNSNQAPGRGKSEMVSPPFPWATTRRATVYSLKYLLDHNIQIITGNVECKRCEKKYEMEYNVVEKFMEVGNYIVNNMSMMHDRAPDVWGHPVFPTCKYCKEENSVRPVMAEKKREINWLFLFLGQMLGCCTLEQLRYFCKHTKNHRTGAKDRVLYLTYLCLCKQLDPSGPFNV